MSPESESVPLRRRAGNKARDVGRSLKARAFGTRFTEKEWRERESDGFYWQSRGHPHRDLLVRTIASYAPSSVLEIGCNTGPNLSRLAEILPGARLAGIDISEPAIEEGIRLFAEAGVRNVELRAGAADDLSAFGDGAFDVVFTDAVMIYIARDKVDRVRQEMLRVARKAIVLVEYHDPDASPRGTFIFKKGYWKRDYISLFQGLPEVEGVSATRLTRELWEDEYWSKLGAVIEVRLADEPRSG